MSKMTVVTDTDISYEAYSEVFATGAEAQAFADQFPKAAKVGAYRKYDGTFYARFHVSFVSNGVNGGTNEAGAKRLASFKRAVAKLGIELA